jgi:hypothetical protein
MTASSWLSSSKRLSSLSRPLATSSINWNKLANIFNQVKLIDVLVSEGAQDVDQASMCKESFKLINATNSEGLQASPNIQTYCHVKLAALRLQRNKEFQIIVESNS